MLVSYNWLKKYVNLPETLTMEQISYDLTMRTVEVEGITDLSEKYNKIVVGLIKSVEAHPNADKLRVLKVDVGLEEPVQIVCGGENLEVDQYVVVTLPGSYAVWHGEGEPVKIEKGKLRGVDSYGMVCGAKEVGLDLIFPQKTDHEIIDLRGYGLDLEPGKPIADVLSLNDWLIEIDNKSLTNRPDLWGHYGIARELSAIYGAELKQLPVVDFDNLPKYPVEIDIEGCRRFFALKYENVSAKKSPIEIQSALMKVGVRPINAIVDITNYVMLAIGQPTHAYDDEHVNGGIIVRKAKNDEKLILLDESELSLGEEDLVIADHEKALGLGGIMGGNNDSILDSTKNILFEAANFDKDMIRHTAQKFGVRTEASMRFEKGLDSQRIDLTLSMGHIMIKELFPEAKLVAKSDVNLRATKSEEVEVSIQWLSRRLGVEVDKNKIEELIKPLGFGLTEKNDDILEVHVPSWRSTGDVSLQDDVLEEIARMIGYENFKLQPPKITLTSAINQKDKTLDRRIREYLSFQCGFQEIFTYPWISEEYIDACKLDKSEMLELAQPPAPDQQYLRSSLIPGTVEAIAKNLRYFDEFKIFEVTEVFKKGEMSPSEEAEILPLQTKELVGSIVGNKPVGLFFEAKGVLENLGLYCQTDAVRFVQEEKPSWADKKAWLNIYSRQNKLGSIGLLSAATKEKAGIKFHDACIFVLNLEEIRPFASRTNTFKHLPLYPHVFQDLSILVDDEVEWSAIRKKIAPHVVSVDFVDEYHGVQIPEGKKSLTFRVEIASEEGTLTNAVVDKKMKDILKFLQSAGANVREA